MRTVAGARAISTVIMNASNAFAPIAQRTIQIMSPIVVATTITMAGNLADGSGRGGGGRASDVHAARGLLGEGKVRRATVNRRSGQGVGDRTHPLPRGAIRPRQVARRPPRRP